MAEEEGQNFGNLAHNIHSAISGMSRAERRVARVLYDSKFEAGNMPVAGLAKKAGVSGPTVLRFTTNLGFSSYSRFQEEVRLQIADRFQSPRTLYERAIIQSQNANPQAASESILKCVKSTLDAVNEVELKKITNLLSNLRRNIYTLGGKSSGYFADIFATRLFQLRPNVQSIGANPLGLNQENQLPFLGSRDVVIAFDFRRYQKSTIFFANAANLQGSTIVLITDTWLSPISDFAHHVMIIDPDNNWPVDFMTPCLALIEILHVVLLSEMNPDVVHKRIRLCEQYATGLIDA